MQSKNYRKLLSVLKKLYHHGNRDYEIRHFGELGFKTDSLDPAELELLNQNGLMPTNFKAFTHDALLAEFLALKQNPKLTLDLCAKLFLKGITGEFPRGRQSLTSYAYLSNLGKHALVPSDTHSNCSNCDVCGLPKSCAFDVTHALYTYHLGHSWNEQPQHFWADLVEVTGFDVPEIGKVELDILAKLLNAINDAEDNETPGQ